MICGCYWAKSRLLIFQIGLTLAVDINNFTRGSDAILDLKQKIDAAKWFIDAIQQRQQTLMTTMNAIWNYQHEYFLDGDNTKPKPMILKDIAEIVGLDISMESRVVNSK